MRAALISMAGQPGALAIAGKTLARRQLDFALAAGCDRIIALGEGASAEALSLRHAADAAGARFQAIRETAALAGSAGAADELLILAPGLLPEAPAIADAMREGPAVLVLPAAAGVRAGFERIDLDRAWAGAAIVPGGLIDRLAGLPEDIDLASALMRAALQARVPERPVPEALLAAGHWTMLGEGCDFAGAEAGWLRRHWAALDSLPAPIAAVLMPLARRGLAIPRLLPALALAAGALLMAGVLAAAWLAPAAGFVLTALAALLACGAAELARLARAPFKPLSAKIRATGDALVDLALLTCGFFAIEGTWWQRMFPPLVLLAALHLRIGPSEAAEFRNRPLLAAMLALAATIGFAAPAIMLAGLALLALAVFARAREAP